MSRSPSVGQIGSRSRATSDGTDLSDESVSALANSPRRALRLTPTTARTSRRCRSRACVLGQLVRPCRLKRSTTRWYVPSVRTPVVFPSRASSPPSNRPRYTGRNLREASSRRRSTVVSSRWTPLERDCSVRGGVTEQSTSENDRDSIGYTRLTPLTLAGWSTYGRESRETERRQVSGGFRGPLDDRIGPGEVPRVV